MTKYNFDLPESTFAHEISRLTNQLWKLIPMRENEEDWEKQIKTIVLELVGMNEILKTNSSLLTLLDKLEGLLLMETTFEFYRKTVFECISLLQGLIKNGQS